MVEYITTGVTVLYDGEDKDKQGCVWGINYQDGHSTSYGWIKPDGLNVEVHNPEHLKKPESLTFKGSSYEKELRDNGKIVTVQIKVTLDETEVTE